MVLMIRTGETGQNLSSRQNLSVVLILLFCCHKIKTPLSPPPPFCLTFNPSSPSCPSHISQASPGSGSVGARLQTEQQRGGSAAEPGQSQRRTGFCNREEKNQEAEDDDEDVDDAAGTLLFRSDSVSEPKVLFTDPVPSEL